MGDYIVFIDSDDYICQDMVQVIKEKMVYPGLDVLFYSAAIQYDIYQPMDKSFYVRKDEICNKIMTGKQLLYKSFRNNYIVSPCVGIYKREFLESSSISFPEGIYYEDNVYSLDVLLSADNVFCIPDKLYIRRIREGSTITSKASLKKYGDIIKIQLLQWKLICDKEIVSSNVIFYKEYITIGIVQVVDMLYEVQENYETLDCEKQLVELFFGYWKTLFNYDAQGWCEMGILFFMLKECGKFIECQENIFHSRDGFQEAYCLIEKKFDYAIENLLKKIPFSEQDKKIAIYGIGRHTEKILSLYKEIVGKINCKLYFVVTDESSTGNYCGRNVVTCDQIENNTDFIVVSSMIYQNEILENLKERKVEKEKIITLYNGNETYDLITAWKIKNV
jgi:hypothetical protein